MACRIKLDSLTEEQKKIIREKLYLQPKKTNFAINRFSNVEKDPILFYWIDKPNNEIVLPYTFANVLFQKHLNALNTYPPGSFNFTGTLRDYQVPIVKEALTHLCERGTTTLALGTGLGKTVCSIVLGSYLINNGTGGLMLVLVKRETILKSWHETIIQNTNCQTGVWIVDTKMNIPKSCNIILCMDGRFEKIPLEIKRLISILVIDEAHSFCVPSEVSVLLGSCPKYIIVCSATLERPDDMHRMILNIVGTHKVEMKLDKQFTVYKICTGIEVEYVKNKQGTTDFSQLTKTLSFHPQRNALIIDCLEQNPKNKFIILSWSKDHIQLLLDILKKRGHSVDFLAGRKSNYIDSRILLGTVSKVSEGFDSKMVSENFDGLDIDSLILVGSTKSHNLHIQSIGRAFRASNPIIYDFVDEDRISKSHWNARKKNYLEMNCEIKEIHINEKKVSTEITQESLTKMHMSRVDAVKNKLKQ